MTWRRIFRRRPPGPGRESERGAALLAAMFLVALMGAVAAVAVEQISYALRRASVTQARDQAQYYALGAEALALARLARADDAARGPIARAAAEGQALAFPIADGVIAATLRDAQVCFNLNSLVGGGEDGADTADAAMAEYVRLLTLLEVSAPRARMLAAALADWVDEDGRVRAGGAEDGAYLAARPPYRAGNARLAEVEELRAVAGYDADVFARLRPLVCAGESAAPFMLNVDALRPEQAPLLAALAGEGLSLTAARAAIAARPAAGYADLAQFRAHPRLAEIVWADGAADRLGLSTARFLLVADVTLRGAHVRVESLIAAPEGGTPRVVARRFGHVE